MLVSTKEIDHLRQNVKEQDQNNITEDVFKDVIFFLKKKEREQYLIYFLLLWG